MNSQQLLLINFVIFAVLVLFFFFGRSKYKQGPKLNIKTNTEPSAKPSTEPSKSIGGEGLAVEDKSKNVHPPPPPHFSTPPSTSTDAVSKPKPSEASTTPVTKRAERDVGPKSKKPKKEIVYFVFNGHEWEAHEVLGLESGVSIEVATKHYQNLIKTADPSTFEFYDAAFSAILKLKRNKW